MILIDSIISGIIYIVIVFIIFILGKFINDKIKNKFKLDEQLVKEDNLAVAVSVAGYYIGLVFAIGGAIVGESKGLVSDIIDISLYGLIAIIAMNIATIIADKIILYKFDNTKEIIQDRNVGTGIVNCATYIAVGLVIFGAVSGEGGSVWTALAFTLLGIVALIITCFVYEWMTTYTIHKYIEKDNIAVGVSFAGVIIAMGIIVYSGVSGDFISWGENLLYFGATVLLGLVFLPLLRFVTDKLLLPGENLTKELIGQEVPNIGAGLIEATSYIAAALLISWCL